MDALQGSGILPVLNFHPSFPREGPRNSGVEVEGWFLGVGKEG